MKAIGIILLVVMSLCFYACNRTVSSTGVMGSGNATGRAGQSYDTLGRITNSDPDGIPGNASTHGTGTGVSGQTPAGTGSGQGNTGKSGVGIRESIK